eukprot:3539893-Rhodomonas_salina.1
MVCLVCSHLAPLQSHAAVKQRASHAAPHATAPSQYRTLHVGARRTELRVAAYARLAGPDTAQQHTLRQYRTSHRSAVRRQHRSVPDSRREIAPDEALCSFSTEHFDLHHTLSQYR